MNARTITFDMERRCAVTFAARKVPGAQCGMVPVDRHRPSSHHPSSGAQATEKYRQYERLLSLLASEVQAERSKHITYTRCFDDCLTLAQVVTLDTEPPEGLRTTANTASVSVNKLRKLDLQVLRFRPIATGQ
eukprot:1185574-Prorocentrum_minimum.AAC.2